MDQTLTTPAQVGTRVVSRVAIIAPKGSLRHDTPLADRLYDSVRRALEEGCVRIIIDFSGVPATDATGLARLARALTSTCRLGGALRLLKVPPGVYDLLEILRLVGVFEIYEDEEEAIRSFD